MRKAEADTLAQFHREFRPALMAFFLRRSQSHSEAEDLTQDVFIRIASKADVSMRSAEAYVFQVAANLLRDRGRRAKVRQDYAAGMRTVEGLGVEPLDPYRVAAGREQLACLAKGLSRVPCWRPARCRSSSRVTRCSWRPAPHRPAGQPRRADVLEEGDYALYLDLLADAAGRAGVEIWSYCLMPNHVHIAAMPSDTDGLRRCFRRNNAPCMHGACSASNPSR